MRSEFEGPPVSVGESVWHCQGCNCGGEREIEWAAWVDLERWALIALEHAPMTCRYHGSDFDKLGWEYGLPRCDSCKQPYKVSKLREALSRVPEAGGTDAA